MFLLPSSTSKSIHVNPGDAPQSRRSFLKHRSKCQSFYHLAARLTLVYCHDALQLIGGNSVKVLAGLYANVIWSYSFNSWFDDTWQYVWWEASLRQHAAYPTRTWKNNSGRLCLDFPRRPPYPREAAAYLHVEKNGIGRARESSSSEIRLVSVVCFSVRVSLESFKMNKWTAGKENAARDCDCSARLCYRFCAPNHA